MSDVMTPEQRSRAMSHIKGKDTSIEVLLRKALWHKGIRYRKNYKKLPGTPDIAITKHKIAIFCDGEFWHGKDWATRKERLKRNREYWIQKIEENIARERRDDARLRNAGWLPVHFWEKDVLRSLQDCVAEIEDCAVSRLVERAEDAEPLGPEE